MENENIQTKLRKLIIENSNADIKIFVGEECNCGDYSYQLGEISSVEVKELTYRNEMFYDEDDMRDYLSDLLYCEQTDEELEKEVNKTMKQAKWELSICVYID